MLSMALRDRLLGETVVAELLEKAIIGIEARAGCAATRGGRVSESLAGERI